MLYHIIIDSLFLGVYGAPDSKVYGANMGPIWGRQDPGGPYVDPKNLAIWGIMCNDPPFELLKHTIQLVTNA